MATPTRYPNGVTTVPVTDVLGQYGLPDPSEWITYFNDFNNYVSGDWTATVTGSGTTALTNGLGGLLLLTNSAANNDAIFTQKIGESFAITAGKKAFFKASVTLSDATKSAMVLGLQITDTTPLVVTDGIFFLKSLASPAIDFYVQKDSSTGKTVTSNVATMTTNSTTFAWYYDGKQRVEYFINGVKLGAVAVSSANLPDSTLTLSFGVQNGEAVAKTLTVDYLFAAVER